MSKIQFEDESGQILREGSLTLDSGQSILVTQRNVSGELTLKSGSDVLASLTCNPPPELLVEGVCQGSQSVFTATNVGDKIPEVAPTL